MVDTIGAGDPAVNSLSEGPCCVCGDALPPVHNTVCEACSGVFHFRMTESSDAKDCGQVYLDDKACTTVFLCSLCFQRHIVQA